MLLRFPLPDEGGRRENSLTWGGGGPGVVSGSPLREDGTKRFQRHDLVERPLVKRRAQGGRCHLTESRQFVSLLIAGHLGRGGPVGSGVLGRQGGHWVVALGLSECLELHGEHMTLVGTQESRQAPAQALS